MSHTCGAILVRAQPGVTAARVREAVIACWTRRGATSDNGDPRGAEPMSLGGLRCDRAGPEDA